MPRLRVHLNWLWLATLPPAAFIAILIIDNAVDVLFMDDWPIIGRILIRAHSGTLGIEDLIGQANESRPFFPRLLFLTIATVSRGDTRWLLLVPFALACLVSWSVFVLARATVTTTPLGLGAWTFLANLLIFTPKHGEAWLWISYIGLNINPIAYLAASLALLYSGLGPGRKVAISAALCTVATFSYANGLVTWLVAAPVVAVAVGTRWLGGWTLGFLLNAGLYFHGYVKPAHHPPVLEGLQPLRLGHYVLAFLGAPLGGNSLATATTVGAFFVVLLACVALYLVMRARDEALRRRLAPWLSIGGYALLSGLAAGMGRSPFGVRQAMVSRYVPFSLCLGLALLFLVPIVLRHARAGGVLRPGSWRVVYGFFLACLAVGLVLHANAAVIGVREIVHGGRMLRYGKSCLLFINVQPDEACLTSQVYPNTAILRAYANGLDRLGYLRPGLVRSRRLQDLRAEGPAVRDAGVFETFENSPGRGLVRGAGWAGLPTAAGPADAVILARRGSDGDWVPLEFAPVLETRPDIARVHGRVYRNSGWKKGLVKRDLPPRPFPISAWAFDAQRGWALPLDGIHTVEAGPRTGS